MPIESNPMVEELKKLRANLIDKPAAGGTTPSVEEVRAAIGKVWNVPGDVKGSHTPNGSSRLLRSTATGLIEDLAKLLPEVEREALLDDLAMISAG